MTAQVRSVTFRGSGRIQKTLYKSTSMEMAHARIKMMAVVQQPLLAGTATAPPALFTGRMSALPLAKRPCRHFVAFHFMQMQQDTQLIK